MDGATPLRKKRVAVLISGSGSNLQALLDAAADPAYPAEIALVISNIAEAYGLARAAKAGVPSLVLSHRDHKERTAYDRAIDAALGEHRIDYVCLAGFMRLLTPEFVGMWEGRMLNIHPSLLPSFKGLDVHRRVLESGVRITGCTVHFVVPEMDAGPVIVQAAVPVYTGDDEAALAARVHAAEHRIYPLALRWLASGALSLEDGRVRVQGAQHEDAALINPL